MPRLNSTLVFIFFCLVILVFSGCSISKETDLYYPSSKVLSFGAVASVDVIPIVIGYEKGFFEDEGLKVQFQAFKNSKDRDAAFLSGNLDGIICDQIALCLYQNADFDVLITGSTDGDFLLIANAQSGINSIDKIRGKRVAISEKTAIEYTLDNILKKYGISPESIEKTMIPAIPTRLEMLRNHKVDAALLPEPFASLALKDGGILLGSASKLGTYPSVTAFTQKSIHAKSDEIKSFYRGYNRAIDYIQHTPLDDYEEIVIKAVGYPENIRGNIRLPDYKKNTLPSEEELLSVIDWVNNYGLIRKELNPKTLINDIGFE
ncbi:MAG: MetQ/NlpA family ABC transporter substrate-binding protein [Thermotaleaceae bacterium]